MQFTVAEFIIKQLVEWEIDTAFGLPGDSFFPFLDALEREKKLNSIPLKTRPQPATWLLLTGKL